MSESVEPGNRRRRGQLLSRTRQERRSGPRRPWWPDDGMTGPDAAVSPVVSLPGNGGKLHVPGDRPAFMVAPDLGDLDEAGRETLPAEAEPLNKPQGGLVP